MNLHREGRAIKRRNGAERWKEDRGKADRKGEKGDREGGQRKKRGRHSKRKRSQERGSGKERKEN